MLIHTHNKIDTPGVRYTDILEWDIDFTAYLLTTTAQTVAGIKTFSSIPVLPASDPTSDNEMARKAYVDAKSATAPDSTISASDRLIDSADDQDSISQFQSTAVKVKDINFNETAGTITVKFDLKDDNGSGGCFGRIYKNGVAAGTTREEISAVWTTYEEDISVNNGDNVQLYVWYDNGGGGAGGQYRNFRLYYNPDLDVTVGTVNLD